MSRTQTDAAPLQTLPSFPTTEGCGTRFLLTIWVADGLWRARAELLDGSKHVFESPFELARFVSQAQTQARPPPDPHAGNGLR
jgi:hypothetical protein